MSNVPAPLEKRNYLLAQKVVKALENRHFAAWYFKTSAEAVEKILSLIPEKSTVAWGGSVTLHKTGVIQKLKEGNYSVIDRESAPTPEIKKKLSRDALLSDTFLSGVNGISEDGQLVNIDGFGNRVAATIAGPEQVILVAGMNKVVRTVEDAYSRAKYYAAPVNVQRFNLKTPCASTGSCAHCSSDDCICSYIVTMRNCRPAQRIKVILIGEELGF
ncbi:MAG: lactate utilization protein [Planctomycetaceae bacterium]|nr:lactate utilization protein [Planctomycetaceae bacterium]